MARATPVAATSRKSRRWRRLRLLVLALVAAPVLGVAGCNSYLLLYEHFRPSGKVYIRDAGGRQVELASRRVLATPSAPRPAESGPDKPRAAAQAADAGPRTASRPASRPADPAPPTPAAGRKPPQPAVYPPRRLVIPSIGVSSPVVLGDNDHLPKFRAIGWYMGSAYPATRGNMVLFGHLDGPNATLGRLSELRPGEGVYVATRKGAFSYTVKSRRVVDRFDTSVMAPTSDARLTLITCAGEWLRDEGTYADRLIVVAEYSGAVDAKRLPPPR